MGGGRTHESSTKFRWPWSGLVSGLATGLLAGLAAGLRLGVTAGLIAVAVGLAYDLVRDGRMNGARWSWPGLVFGLIFGLMFGLMFGLSASVVARRILGLVVGLVAGLAGGLAYERIRADGMKDASATINPAEELRWSGLRGVLRIGLGSGLGAGLIGTFGGLLRRGLEVFWEVVLNYGLSSTLIVTTAVVLAFVLLSELPVGFAKATITPNEGIRRSARRSLMVGLSGGLVVVVAVGLVVAVFVGWTAGPIFGLKLGLVFGVVFGLVSAVAVGLEFGGIACLRHLTLRYLLTRNGAPPWRFLDDAAKRLFLYRSGGSYLFRHSSLHDYFADLKGSHQAGEPGSAASLNTTGSSL